MSNKQPVVTSKTSRYAWYVLAMAFLANFCVSGISFTSMPVLFKEISLDFGLDLVQLGSLWSAFVIGQAIFFLPGGAIGDRLGIRKIVSLGCLIGALGCLGRGLSNNYATLAVFMFVSAPAFTFLQPNAIKAVSTWFEERRIGLAAGITLTGFASGAAVGSLITATRLSPLLGGWRNVMFLYGAVALIIGIIWFLTIKEPKQDESDKDIGGARVLFREAFFRVTHTRDVWLMAMAFVGIMCCISPIMGYLAVYFENIGLEKAVAHSLVAVNFGAAFSPVEEHGRDTKGSLPG